LSQPDTIKIPEDYRKHLLKDLETLVNINSSSQNPEGLKKNGEALLNISMRLGLPFSRIPVPNDPGGRFHLIYEPPHDVFSYFYGITGHFDTVHLPESKFCRLTSDLENARIYGPGVLDMKAGVLVALYALAAVKRHTGMAQLPFKVVFNCDEEIGSPDSRHLIAKKFKGAAGAFVMEGGKDDVPCVITSRKGILMGKMRVSGKAAHAGENPERGASAIVEAAYKIRLLNRLNDPESGTVVTVGTISGGNAANQIPDHCSASIDVRVKTLEAEKKVSAAISEIMQATHVAGTRTDYDLNQVRPPFESDARAAALLQVYLNTCARSGIQPKQLSTGGGSDANLTAAMGIPTLDGIGPTGSGPHTDHEYIVAVSLYQSLEVFTLFLFTLINHQEGGRS